MTSSDRERILDRIRSLLVKSRDKACTEDEAAACATMAERLLREHNLTLDETIEPEFVRRVWEARYADPWRRSIVFAAARLYMCQALNTEYQTRTPIRKGPFKGQMRTTWKRGFVFVGQEHCTVVAQEMTEYFCNAVVRLARQYTRDSHNPDQTISPRQMQTEFERGCGEALAHRLKTIAWERSQEQRRIHESNPEQLPVNCDSELDRIREWMDDTMSLRAMRARGSSMGDHSGAGANAAASIGVDTQVGGSSAGTRLLS